MQHRLLNIKEGRHGHSCGVEVSISAPWNTEFEQIVQTQVVQKLDGKIVNQILQNPTGENIVEWIFGQLELTKLKNHIVAVSLQETGKNRFLSSRNGLFLS